MRTRAAEWKEEQMQSLSPAVPPPDVNLAAELLKALSDPKAAKAFLEKVVDTHAAAAKAQAAELTRLRAAHEDKLAVLSQRHAESLAADRKAFQSECAKREAELRARERKVAEQESTVEARERAADETRADYNRRRGELARIASKSP